VTADGAVRIANARTNADLFAALKGGGGGSFGFVTRITFRTLELPGYFGGVFTVIRASSDAAFRRLIAPATRRPHEFGLFSYVWHVGGIRVQPDSGTHPRETCRRAARGPRWRPSAETHGG
jgi:FAD/FMN-containing dehydrogenase